MPEDSTTAPNDAQPRANGRHATPPSVPDHQLLRRIGQGAYGEVWLARNVIGTLRAVKVVYRDAFADARPYEREFQGIQKFEPLSRTHEGLVDVLQIGLNEQAGYFYYVMELADAANDECRMTNVELSDRSAGANPNSSFVIRHSEFYTPRTLSSDLKSQGRLPFAQCLRTALALADALEHLHQQGLIHRDIKPSNIIFVNGTPKLADIGLVTETGAGKSWVGTEGFMPPEGPGTAQGDIYSLGKVLYEISTGKDRQRFPEPLTALADLPDQADWLEFNEVVEKACQGDPQRRYSSATELRGDLALLLGGKSVRRLRRMEKLFAVGRYVAAAILAVGIVAVLLVRAAEARRQARLHLLLQQVQFSRSASHTQGWRAPVWQRVQEAARIQANADVQAHAAATLAGLDARRLTNIQFAGSSILFDREDRRVLIGGSATNGAKLWDSATGQLQHFNQIGFGPVAFLADGTALQFIAANRTTFQLFDVVRQQVIREFQLFAPRAAQPPLELPPPVLAMTPDASLVGAAVDVSGRDGIVALWEASTGRTLLESTQKCNALTFSPDGALAAGGRDDGNIVLWSLADGNKPRVFRFDETAITGLTFGPDLHRSVTATNRPGWVLAAGDSAGRITVWDLRTFCHGGQFLGSHFEVQAIAFSPDGMTLVSGGRTPNECWDLATGRSLLHLAAGDDITGLSFTAHGQKLAVSSKARFSAGQVEVWQLEFGRGIRTLLGLATEVTKVRFSRDGQWLAALSLDWRVAMWNLKETRLRYVIKVPAGASADNAALRFSPDSQQFAFCAGTQATVWATASGQISQTWPLPPGLCDVLTWHEPKKLLLFRGETVDGVPPYGNDATKHPRVCVLRNLRGESSTKPLFTFPDFNWHLWNATAPESGRFFIVLGERSQGKTRTIQAAAYDSRSGTNLWTIPPGLLGGASTFVVDPEGTRLIGSTAAVLVLIDTASGHWHKNAGPVMKAISHSGTNWLVEGMPGVHDRGWSVFAAGRKEPLVTLGIDAQRSYLPEFSSNDRLVAWGNTDGTVTVCDLDEMRRHLSKTGLGW